MSTRAYPNSTLPVLTLGTFKVGTRVTVSDPCYLMDDQEVLHYDTESTGDLPALAAQRLAPGTWHAEADLVNTGLWGERVLRSVIYVDGHATTSRGPDEITDQPVDAGMVGYFLGDPEILYAETYASDERARLITRATGTAYITESGYGDGLYPVHIWLTMDNTVLRIETFFNDEDEDDQEADDE